MLVLKLLQYILTGNFCSFFLLKRFGAGLSIRHIRHMPAGPTTLRGLQSMNTEKFSSLVGCSQVLYTAFQLLTHSKKEFHNISCVGCGARLSNFVRKTMVLNHGLPRLEHAFA